jgi:hypothetical protein
MKKSAHLVPMLLFATMFLVPAVSQASSLLVDYVGYDYEWPDPDSTQFGEVGAGYNGLGIAPGLFAPLVTNQYTYMMDNLTVSGVTVVGSYAIIAYSGPGRIRVFEDPKAGGTAADYGTYPPNGTAPPSFTDGTLILEGTLTGFQVVLNTDTGSGSFDAQFDVTGGSQYANFLPDQLTGWTFAGVTSNDIHRPAGYAHQVDGQIFVNSPVPTRPTTWGKLKTLYR